MFVCLHVWLWIYLYIKMNNHTIVIFIPIQNRKCILNILFDHLKYLIIKCIIFIYIYIYIYIYI